MRAVWSNISVNCSIPCPKELTIQTGCAHLRTRFGYKFSAENSELSSERFAAGHWSSDHHCSLGLTWFADSIVCLRPCTTFSIFRVHGLPIKFGTKLMLAIGACSTPARSLASLFCNILNPKTQEYTMNTPHCSWGNVKPTLNRTSLITREMQR